METVETLDYMKGSDKSSKVRYSFASLHTHNLHWAFTLNSFGIS